MKTRKTDLLAGVLAATMVTQENKDFYEYTNPYSGFNELTYRGSSRESYSKTPLTKKQKKARARTKFARKARRKQRK